MNTNKNCSHVPRIPGFTLICRCGKGYSSEVWLGKNAAGGRYAIRLVSKRRDPALVDMERQAVSLYCTAGKHDHLLEVLRADETPEYFYCIMEPADNVCRGTGRYEPDTLARRLHRRTDTFHTALNYLEAIAAGLEQLHGQNIVHTDLQPENILFVHGVLKIADPGSVLRSDAVPRGGTAGFRPPWKASGTEHDIYALGKLIYMLCTHEDPDSFPDIPQYCNLEDFLPLNEISLCCCEREERNRFRHVSDVRRELDQARKFLREGSRIISSAGSRTAS